MEISKIQNFLPKKSHELVFLLKSKLPVRKFPEIPFCNSVSAIPDRFKQQYKLKCIIRRTTTQNSKSQFENPK